MLKLCLPFPSRWLMPTLPQQQKVVDSITPSLGDALLLIRDTLTVMNENMASAVRGFLLNEQRF